MAKANGKQDLYYLIHSGMHGCLPNDTGTATSYDDAVDYAVSLFSLGRDRKAQLKKNSTLELNLKRDFAEYVEIVPVDEGTFIDNGGEVEDEDEEEGE